MSPASCLADNLQPDTAEVFDAQIVMIVHI